MQGINQRTVNVKVTRHELCDIIIALNAVLSDPDCVGGHWEDLRRKLNDQLHEFDAKLTDKEIFGK